MRDGNVPRFFVRQKERAKPSWWDGLRDQLAGPANPANPSFSGKEEREEKGKEKREGEGEGDGEG